MIALDGAIGALIEELRSTDEFDNTLIAVSGDCGPAGISCCKVQPLYLRHWGVSLAVAGRERQVDVARKSSLPYPQRGIHTISHLYIINFKPERSPLGDPGSLLASEK